jgi:hypothetical protein
MEEFCIGRTFYHCRCFGGDEQDENTMDGECSPSLNMLKEMEIQWMESVSHCFDDVSSKSCSIHGECFPLPLLMSTKKLFSKQKALPMWHVL